MRSVFYIILFSIQLLFVQYSFAGRCTGSSYCSACKNCSACKHCNGGGGTCGVCGGGNSYRSDKQSNSSYQDQPSSGNDVDNSSTYTPDNSSGYSTSSQPGDVSKEPSSNSHSFLWIAVILIALYLVGKNSRK